MDLEKRQNELEELYNDLDQRKLVGIILELTIENIDLKKQLSIHGVVQPNLTYKHPIEGVNEFTQTETELEDMPDCPNCGSDAVGFDGINGFYECFQCDDNWIA